MGLLRACEPGSGVGNQCDEVFRGGTLSVIWIDVFAAVKHLQENQLIAAALHAAGYEASPFVKLTREVLPTPTAGG